MNPDNLKNKRSGMIIYLPNRYPEAMDRKPTMKAAIAPDVLKDPFRFPRTLNMVAIIVAIAYCCAVDDDILKD